MFKSQIIPEGDTPSTSLDVHIAHSEFDDYVDDDFTDGEYFISIIGDIVYPYPTLYDVDGNEIKPHSVCIDEQGYSAM